MADLRSVPGIKGEPSTGYEDSNGLGEFECENCSFFRDGGCGQKVMMAKSKQPRLPDGRVKVDPEGCCEFVDRVGRQDEDEDEESHESRTALNVMARKR